jgi:uncharacterized protein YqeY
MQFEQLQKDMVTAMKAHDKVRKEAISSLISAVKKLAIDEGSRDNIQEELINRAILKEMKLVQEQVETCPDERVELKESYRTTYNIMKEYAPSMMSEDEIKAFILDKYADLVATKNKGMIMKSVVADLKGKADGKLINQIVGKLTE